MPASAESGREFGPGRSRALPLKEARVPLPCPGSALELPSSHACAPRHLLRRQDAICRHRTRPGSEQHVPYGFRLHGRCAGEAHQARAAGQSTAPASHRRLPGPLRYCDCFAMAWQPNLHTDAGTGAFVYTIGTRTGSLRPLPEHRVPNHPLAGPRQGMPGAGAEDHTGWLALPPVGRLTDPMRPLLAPLPACTRPSTPAHRSSPRPATPRQTRRLRHAAAAVPAPGAGRLRIRRIRPTRPSRRPGARRSGTAIRTVPVVRADQQLADPIEVR